MALYTVSNGNTANAADLNQVINILQAPAGNTETGKYRLETGTYAVNAFVSQYIRSTSQNTTPVSVSIDTADQSAVAYNAPTTGNLTSAGFSVKATGTGTNTDPRVAGNYTIQY